MGLGQIVALMKVNNCMKCHETCFSTFKVIAKVIVCHEDNDYDDTLNFFSLKNSRAQNDQCQTISRITLAARIYIICQNKFLKPFHRNSRINAPRKIVQSQLRRHL